MGLYRGCINDNGKIKWKRTWKLRNYKRGMYKGHLASVYVHSYTGSEGRSELTGYIARRSVVQEKMRIWGIRIFRGPSCLYQARKIKRIV